METNMQSNTLASPFTVPGRPVRVRRPGDAPTPQSVWPVARRAAYLEYT